MLTIEKYINWVITWINKLLFVIDTILGTKYKNVCWLLLLTKMLI